MSEEIGQELVVRLERQINAPPQKVWSIIASIDGMSKWLGPKTFEPQLGGRVLFDVQHQAQRWIMFGNVTSFDENARLAFTWQEVDTQKLTVWPAPTEVSVTLASRDGGTLVTLVHGGFDTLPDGREQYEGYAEGWASLNDLDELARMCEM